MTNKLYYGDNLDVLRQHIAAESVDLVYLDPPFNSKRDYNLLFKSPKGQQSKAQITAFEDSWHWGDQAEREFDELLRQQNTNVAELMRAFRSFLGENDMMAYVTMMANRLLELHRVLKPTGSLYLHCDPTASHYLKIVLDSVFGKERFLNEVVWKRTGAHGSSKRWGPVHDTILFYAPTDNFTWNQQYQDQADYVAERYTYEDKSGRMFYPITLHAFGVRHGESGKVWRGIDITAKGGHWKYAVADLDKLDERGDIYWPAKVGGMPRLKMYADEAKGAPAQDIWTDVFPVNSQAQERLGYPTQKPLALLQRIINASSNPGDIILDPFCGCGTAVHAAQKLNRSWIGIDVTHLAISLIEKRLKDAFPDSCKFEVHGTPEDLDAARDLAARDKYQFQWWAVSLVDAQPFQAKKKGADTGIDGLKFFNDLEGDARKIVVSVKGGASLKPDDIRAINHVRDREKAEIGILISLADPTPKMRAEAAAAGIYSGGADGKTKYPRLQLLTIEGLLSGTQRAQHPDFVRNVNFKRAAREKKHRQKKLDM